jgi:hypothetical protein
MIPAGYMAKRVVGPPDWLKSDAVTDIYSGCFCWLKMSMNGDHISGNAELLTRTVLP